MRSAGLRVFPCSLGKREAGFLRPELSTLMITEGEADTVSTPSAPAYPDAKNDAG